MEEKRPEKLGKVVNLLREVVETVLPAILIALFINIFIAQATKVQGQSMEPNLHPNQRLVVEKLTYRFHGPRRGDIVVIRRGNQLLIKRVIGLAGERIEIRKGKVYIDGQSLKEPYLERDFTSVNYGPVTVPPLHIFILGDNRTFSNDSRSFGPVPIENVVGRAWLSYWPPNQIGLVK
jgi:signal peptidase I